MNKPHDERSKESARFQRADELGGIELLDAEYHKQNFSRHSHEGFTVGVIERGAQRFYRTGGEHVAPQDSIILVNADEVHTGHSAVEGGWAYRAMYPLPEQFATIAREMGANRYGSPYFPSAVVNDADLANQFRLVFDTLQHSENRLLRETLIYASLVKLMTRHGKHAPKARDTGKLQQQLKVVKEFLDDFPQADVSLDELAQLAGISAFHLVRAFQKMFGLPPHAYQIQSRLRYAKTLLRAGHSIADTAQQCGFHDQSHLHRHFKRAMGITPRQYLQS